MKLSLLQVALVLGWWLLWLVPLWSFKWLGLCVRRCFFFLLLSDQTALWSVAGTVEVRKTVEITKNFCSFYVQRTTVLLLVRQDTEYKKGTSLDQEPLGAHRKRKTKERGGASSFTPWQASFETAIYEAHGISNDFHSSSFFVSQWCDCSTLRTSWFYFDELLDPPMQLVVAAEEVDVILTPMLWLFVHLPTQSPPQWESNGV